MPTFDLLALLGSAAACGVLISIVAIRRYGRRGRRARLVGRVLEPPTARSREGEEMRVEVDGRPRRVLLGGAPVELGRRPARIGVGERVVVIGESGQRLCDERLYRDATTESLIEAHRVERAGPLTSRGWAAPALLAASVLTLGAIALRDGPERGVVRDVLLERAGRIMCQPGTRAQGRASVSSLAMLIQVEVSCELPGGRWHGLALASWDDESSLTEHRYGRQHGLHLVAQGNRVKLLARYVDGLEDGVSTSFWSNGNPRTRVERARGVRHGRYECFDRQGQSELLLNFRDGRAEGEHRELEDGELVHRGRLREGAREGLWVLQRDCPCPELTEEVRKCEVTYRAGQLEGPAFWVFKDGSRMQGGYRQGKATGYFEVIHNSKVPLRRGNYRENVRDGRWIWSSDHPSSKGARAERVGHYRLGQQHGRWVESVIDGAGTVVSETEAWYLRDVKVTRQVFEQKEPAALAAY